MEGDFVVKLLSNQYFTLRSNLLKENKPPVIKFSFAKKGIVVT